MINFMGPSPQMANMYMRSRMPRQPMRQMVRPGSVRQSNPVGMRTGGNITPMPRGNTGVAGGIGIPNTQMPQGPIGPSYNPIDLSRIAGGFTGGMGGPMGNPMPHNPLGDRMLPGGNITPMPPPGGGFVPIDMGGGMRPGDLSGSAGPIGAAYRQGRIQTLGY
jgi:hypothetical protein